MNRYAGWVMVASLPPLAVTWAVSANRSPPTVVPDQWALALHGVARHQLEAAPVVRNVRPVLPLLEARFEPAPDPAPKLVELVPDLPPDPPPPVKQPVSRRSPQRLVVEICAAHGFRRVQHGLSWHCRR